MKKRERIGRRDDNEVKVTAKNRKQKSAIKRIRGNNMEKERKEENSKAGNDIAKVLEVRLIKLKPEIKCQIRLYVIQW